MDDDKLINNISTLKDTDIEKNQLYSWFEKKGFLNKIRAHISQLTIASLKDGHERNNSLKKGNFNSSKIQAINLLVADFLMNQDNMFTLKVFTTEVPLLGNLREIFTYINGLESNHTKIRFLSNDVQDILAALGVQPNSNVMELTCEYYSNQENQDCSLLACLFKAITTKKSDLNEYNEIQNINNCVNKPEKVDYNTYEHRLNNWLESLEAILSSFNLDEKQKNTIKQLFKGYHQNNYMQESAKYREHLKKLKIQSKEMIKKVTDLDQMLATNFNSCDNKLLFQREQQLRLEQQQLYQLTKVFEEKEKSLNKKLQDVEKKKNEMETKEIEILRCEKMLKDKLIKHNVETNSFKLNHIQLLQEYNIDLSKQLKEIKLKLDELEKNKLIEQLNSKKFSIDVQKIEPLRNNEIERNLQRENHELREFIKVQQQRIEELSIRASNLAKQIEKTHQVFPTVPDYQNKNVKTKLFVENLNKKKNINQSSTTTTDLSTSILESDNQTEDDMIKEARSRLKILEMNTAKVEQNFKDFQTHRIKHIQNSSNFKITQNDKKPFNNILSQFSDDSDLGVTKYNENRINLKMLANKIGYHRSVRRSRNTSPSENDTSPETFKNSRFQCYKSTASISQKKISESKVDDIFGKESSSKKSNSKITSPLMKENNGNESPLDIITQSPKENQLQMKSTIINMPNISWTNDNLENEAMENEKSKTIDNIETKNYITSPNKSYNSIKRIEENNYAPTNNINQNTNTTLIQNSLSDIEILGESKKELESDHTVSFGSIKTDKSSDFWA